MTKAHRFRHGSCIALCQNAAGNTPAPEGYGHIPAIFCDKSAKIHRNLIKNR